MIFYYINPKTHHLIIYDSEEGEMFITARIPEQKIRSMIVGGQITMGGHEEDDPFRKRQRTLITKELIEKMKKMATEGLSNVEIASALEVSHQTVYNHLEKNI